MDTQKDDHLDITVAVLTRQRPRMLISLLASWRKTQIPAHCTVRFLVVENDTAPHSRDLVEREADSFENATLAHVLETETGIPFGRNCAARQALVNGSTLLAFVDDDEVVATDWLVKLIAGYRASQAVLLGAPLRAGACVPEAGRLARIMHRNIASRYARNEKRAAAKATLNSTPGVTIVTNNWLAETTLFQQHDIWFDEALRYTGGSDAEFYNVVKTKGLTTGWVSDAFVYETIPIERLSFTYQYARGRDQANSHFRRKLAQNPKKSWELLALVPIKAIIAVGLAIGIPLTGGRTLLACARSAGWISGRIGAVRGRKSTLYLKVTGG